MKLTVALLVIFLLQVGSALDCSGPADIVIAVPGSFESVPEVEFRLLEDFLIGFVSYYKVSKSGTNVGLVLYGREPVVISDLTDAVSSQAINTRITLLSQRSIVHNQLSGGQNVPKAILKVHEMLKAGREDVPKIGVIMTYGSADLTSSNATVVRAHVDNVSKSALNDGVSLFAASTGGTVPGFPNITRNVCRLFSLGSYSHLDVLLPYFASAACYVVDDNVTTTSLNCFPEIQPRPITDPFQCGPNDSAVADPTNCAYWYMCPLEERMFCGVGRLFEPAAHHCIHKEFATCYNGLTCPSEKGLFPHPWDCNKFLSCSENIPYVHECPRGLRFNPVKEYCDYKKNVLCDSNEQTTDWLPNRIPS